MRPECRRAGRSRVVLPAAGRIREAGDRRPGRAVAGNRAVGPDSQAADPAAAHRVAVPADSRAEVPAGNPEVDPADSRAAAVPAGSPAAGRAAAGSRAGAGNRKGAGNRPAGAARNRSGRRGRRSRMGPRRRVIRPEVNLREGAGTLRTSWSRTNGHDVHSLRGRRSARQQANGIPDARASVADTLTGRRSPAVTESDCGLRNESAADQPPAKGGSTSSACPSRTAVAAP